MPQALFRHFLRKYQKCGHFRQKQEIPEALIFNASGFCGISRTRTYDRPQPQSAWSAIAMAFHLFRLTHSPRFGFADSTLC